VGIDLLNKVWHQRKKSKDKILFYFGFWGVGGEKMAKKSNLSYWVCFGKNYHSKN